MDLPQSCGEGACGTCRVRVLSGATRPTPGGCSRPASWRPGGGSPARPCPRKT
ncbi:2Fe-2S iron-sulfur cluster-binding protein [Actinoplanes sp. NPDC051513]|uniref:2Fe-2S iron-sulfur cluster-binding protein n=1 Tax=Actinoplanes sp. NPDC051513 TaxID=3363908 RepID=UPI00379EBABE